MAKATGTSKTTPNVRDEAAENVFAKEFLVSVDDSSKVSDDLIKSNFESVKLEAEQRGLRLTGDVTLKSQEPQDAHNVLLTYTVSVKPATDH